MKKIDKFQDESVTFVDSSTVCGGVVCDVYTYEDDFKKDLGIVSVEKGCRTPLQRVLKGEKTIEGHMSGAGTLAVTLTDGEKREYHFPNEYGVNEVVISIGDVVQWVADKDQSLMFYEICYPPYEDGRFENIG